MTADMALQTSAQDVIDRFCLTPAASAELNSWQRDKPEVAEHVLAHVSRVPYGLSSATLAGVMESTRHPLGDIRKTDIKDVTAISDWHPRFAVVHVLHYALESLGGVFTYDQFREFCSGDDKAETMLVGPACEAVADAARSVGAHVARDAMTWRIGLFYYSFLRELFILCKLRERGLPLEMRPLADALFRVDHWAGNTVVGLYVRNQKYRDGECGRKPRTLDLLGTGFNLVSLDMPTQHTYGRVHVPDTDTLDAAASRIKAALTT